MHPTTQRAKITEPPLTVPQARHCHQCGEKLDHQRKTKMPCDLCDDCAMDEMPFGD